jgi:aminoglycoside 6'-N-acetyltransferase I
MAALIKRLGPGDEAAFARIADDLFDNPVDPDFVREFLADPRHHIAVAIDDGLMVAFASGVHYVHPDKAPQLFVNEVAVAPTHRRQGLGKAVLLELFEAGRLNHCTEAWVLTDDENPAAMALYASSGGINGADPESADKQMRGFTFALGK